MEEQKTEEKKLSYEELNNYAHQLSNQVYQMRNKMREMDVSRVLMRLDYLFRVVEMGDKFPSDFVISCIDEITVALKKPESKAEENTEANGEEGK